MVGDFELFDAWQGGDAAAGSALFERHFEMLYRFFSYKVGEDAEELIQHTMLACVESRDRFAGTSRFSTFLLGIARNKLFDYWRKRARDDQRLDFGVSSLADLGPSPKDAAAKNREERLLLEALRNIALDLQITIELHYWEGMSGSELAAVLDIPEGTVRSRLRRAKEALERELRRLSKSAQVLESTLSDLERWAQGLHASVPVPTSLGATAGS